MGAEPKIQKNRCWLVAGSAPGAERFFDTAHAWALRVGASEIATNAAWQLYATAVDRQHPDYYWISDSRACELFGRAARSMRRAGTRIVTMRRTAAGLNLRALPELDPIVLDIPDRGDGAPTYEPGVWTHPRLSGLMSLQIAAHHLVGLGGVVVLVGMTGYRSAPHAIVADTLDGRMGKAAGSQHTREWIGPYTQSVIDAHRSTTFVIAGTPLYPLRGFNVVIAPNPGDLGRMLDLHLGSTQ